MLAGTAVTVTLIVCGTLLPAGLIGGIVSYAIWKRTSGIMEKQFDDFDKKRNQDHMWWPSGSWLDAGKR